METTVCSSLCDSVNFLNQFTFPHTVVFFTYHAFNCFLYLSSILYTDSKTSLQDTLVIKTPKKTPLILTMVVLLLTMVCGVHICIFFLKHLNTNKTMIKFLNIEVIDHHNESCLDPHLEQWEIPYVHYPQPQTFKR